jgi:hypothetical protein
MRRALYALFALGILMLALGGYVASISEWFRGLPRDETDAIKMKRAAIILIVPGGIVAAGSTVGIYLVGKRQ